MGSHHFLVTRFIDGRPFPGRMGPVPWEAVEETARRLLGTLARLHGLGVVHRDLKPANVLVKPDGEPVVIDFGLAQGHVRGAALLENAYTPLYAAPEQLSGQAIGPWTDLYAVGLMLFEALAGTVPHLDSAGRFVPRLRIEGDRPQLEAECPDAVRQAVERLLSPDPSDRPETAADVLALLGVDLSVEDWLPGTDGWSSAAELEPLFNGPEPFVHRRSAAAKVLWLRTGGDRSRVRAELDAWLHDGLASRDEGLITVEPSALERLREPVPMRRHDGVANETESVALAWLKLMWPAATTQQLRAVAGEDVAACVDGLRQRGLVWSLDCGRPACDLAASSATATAEMRRAVAAVTDDPLVQVRELLRSGAAPDRWLADVPEMGREALVRGDLATARRLVDVGLELCSEAPVEVQEALVAVRVSIGLAEESAGGLVAAQTAIERAGVESPLATQAEQLVRARMSADRGEPERALELAEAIGPIVDDQLENWRQAVFITAELGAGLDVQVARMEEFWRWADASRASVRAERQALVAGWHGNLKYRQGDFAGAAALHARAAAGKRLATGRLASGYNQAMALLEDLDLGAARTVAQAVVQQARMIGHSRAEASGGWVVRTVGYRVGDVAPAPDDLIEGAMAVSPFVGALHAMNEAAISWRMGDKHRTVQMCRAAAAGFSAPRHGVQRLIVDTLAWHAQGASSPARSVLVQAVRCCELPRVRAQLLCLLGCTEPADVSLIARGALAMRSEDRSVRLEVMSLSEALHGVQQECGFGAGPEIA